jgi:hypothetical protein
MHKFGGQHEEHSTNMPGEMTGDISMATFYYSYYFSGDPPEVAARRVKVS